MNKYLNWKTPILSVHYNKQILFVYPRLLLIADSFKNLGLLGNAVNYTKHCSKEHLNIHL